MAHTGRPTSKGVTKRSIRKTSGEKKAIEVQNDNPRTAPTKKVLGNLNVSTELYTGADVDALLEANRLIEDEDIPGDFYMISIKSGRLIVRKVENS